MPVRQAKQDLMHLGIELDDRLIERLQKNLKIDKIFHVAHEVSNIIKTNPKLPSGSVQEMTFRYVSPELEQEQSKYISKAVNPFQKELFQLDSKATVSLLRRLEDRNDDIHPQHRPHIDRMVQTFQIQYSRCPEKFVGRLLGQKWTAQEKRNPDLIARSILQHRYVTKDEFKTMIRRVHLDSSTQHFEEDVLNSLFKALAEEKVFGATKPRIVVDLWSFLTLIKAATDQSRRSFDSKTSQLANAVEFWSKVNNPPSGPRDDHRIVTKEHPAKEPVQASRPQSAPRMRPKTASSMSVADALGQHDYIQNGFKEKGRRVMGTFASELRNGSDVANALNSKVPSTRPSSPLSHRWVVSECDVPMGPPENMLDSTKVAYLLGQVDANQLKKNERDPSVQRRRTTSNYFYNEVMDRASVSESLGKGAEDFRASGSELNNNRFVSPIKEKKDSPSRTGGKVGLRLTVEKKEVNKTDYYFDTTAHSRAHDRRRKLRDTTQLHWNDIKSMQQGRPSVASALKMQ